MIFFFLEGLHTTTYSILRALNLLQNKRQAISFSKTHSILVPNICPLFFLSFFYYLCGFELLLISICLINICSSNNKLNKHVIHHCVLFPSLNHMWKHFFSFYLTSILAQKITSNTFWNIICELPINFSSCQFRGVTPNEANIFF